MRTGGVTSCASRLCLSRVPLRPPRGKEMQPWDKSIIREVEKGIQEANLGLNPMIDGGILRVPVPELTGERRQARSYQRRALEYDAA